VHEVLHVAILVAAIAGVASLALLILWPLVVEGPLPPRTRTLLGAIVLVAAALFLLEWRVVH
jgi:hypothetical protein